MSDKYILEADHTLRPTDDLEEWARAFEAVDRRVARTEMAPGVVVSTVFLGIDHSFGHGLPLVFETMIFRAGSGEEQWRYSTWEEAEAGHKRAVEVAAQGMAPEGRGREGGPGSSELPSPVAISDAPNTSQDSHQSIEGDE